MDGILYFGSTIGYMEDLSPNVLKCVPLKVRKTRTMFEAMQHHTWVIDIRSALCWRGLAEYLELWVLEINFQLRYL
jgi:hypothetical protein